MTNSIHKLFDQNRGVSWLQFWTQLAGLRKAADSFMRTCLITSSNRTTHAPLLSLYQIWLSSIIGRRDKVTLMCRSWRNDAMRDEATVGSVCSLWPFSTAVALRQFGCFQETNEHRQLLILRFCLVLTHFHVISLHESSPMFILALCSRFVCTKRD